MRVLDLSCDVAGRFGTKLLGASGLEVIRCAPDAAADDSLSLYLDRGKKRAPADRLPELLEDCDIVWTSFDAGRLLGHASRIAPPEGCVHVTTSSFGLTGPYAAWRGGSMVDWAAGGYLYITGDPDREPLSGPEHLCAYAAGYTAAVGAQAALIDRQRTGRGRHLDVSTMEAMLLLHQSTFSRTAAGQLRRRTGRYTEVYPLTVLPCRDGHVSIGVVSDAEFDKLSIAVGRPDLPADPRFTDRFGRWDHRDALDVELARYLDFQYADTVVEQFQRCGVACAKVAEPLEVVANPQLAYRGFWQEVDGRAAAPGYPLRCFHPFPGAGENDRGGISPANSDDLPLAGVRVLDFSIFWAGPSATRLLADMGADVIWVERPGSRLDTELAQGAPPSSVALQMHLYDRKMFRGKRSIALDLEDVEDRALACRLARDADIVVENFRPGVADKLGIGHETLGRLNPRLTYVSLSGWGSEGPWSDWRSYGPSIEAASSIEWRTGYVGGEPLRLGHTLPDGIGGLAGALAALTGLRRSLATGQGGWFDISQFEAYVAMAGDGILEAPHNPAQTQRVGNRSREAGVIQGVYLCRGADQWIALRLENASDRLCLAQLAQLDAGILDAVDDAERTIAAFTRGFDKAELAERLQGAGLQAFPVLDAAELMADEHLRQRDYFVSVSAGTGAYALPGTPFVSFPPMARPSTKAPRPGEDSAIVRSLDAAGSAWRTDGILRGAR
jgi:crotonobetainyl-CoA:carnitine CoA-transferase CaiB-like acyl-CoA transferase